jgi:hypothetical protein
MTTVNEIQKVTDQLIEVHLESCLCHHGPEESECKTMKTIRRANQTIRDGGPEDVLDAVWNEVFCAKYRAVRSISLSGEEISTVRCALTAASRVYESQAKRSSEDRDYLTALAGRCWKLYDRIYNLDECRTTGEVLDQ